MKGSGLIAATALALAALPASPVAAQDVANSPAATRPLFDRELAEARRTLDEMMAEGVKVPVPKDPGGGPTHEQHKRNYRAIQLAGQLFRITGEQRYIDYGRNLLLAYADLYPTLNDHPARSNQQGGRLFWQVLNDAVWLVYAAQGYEAIRPQLTPAERDRIDDRVFRPAARFLSVDSAATFNRIHNHATWATAGVGMTGYLLGDRALVDAALLGSDETGKAGFLRQVDRLFSPEGYYAEGPYYQRYALLPFLVFADAIDRNEPDRRIFERRDGVLLKALRTTIQLTYAGRFFPLNDALKEKGLRTDELYEGVAIVYAKTRDPNLLSIAQWQGHTILTDAGRRVSDDLAAGLARPFPFASTLLRDGPDGTEGALAILRDGSGWDGQAVVAKNTSQGMGHGHFDKLGWLFFDNGREVVTDYGAARFLNVEAKEGGRYLPENDSWAQQTIAHNSLVVDGTSHFGGDADRAERSAPTQLAFIDTPDLRLSAARIDDAAPGVAMIRTLAMVTLPGSKRPLVLDVLRARSATPHDYDLPLHYAGHIMRVGFETQPFTGARPVLGTAKGYQHIWIDARGRAKNARDAFVTWLLGDRFYTARWLPQAGSRVVLGESGAGDPHFNLRREPVLLQRLSGARDATFVSMLEPHGLFDGERERTVDSDSAVADLTHVRDGGVDLITVTSNAGVQRVLALSYDADSAHTHSARLDGQTVQWRGYAAWINPDAETAK